MKKFSTWLGWACTIVLSCLVARGAFATPNAAKSFAGNWQTTLQEPSGVLDITFQVVPLRDDEYTATFSIAQQKAQPLLATVATDEDSVLLVVPEAKCRFLGRLSADGNQLTGTWRQGGVTVPMQLKKQASLLTVASRPPYREEEIHFDSPESKASLTGTLSMPNGTDRFPAVVLLSDGDWLTKPANTAGYVPLDMLASYLTQRGIVVLRYTENGADASASLANRVANVRAAISFLRTRSEVNLDYIGVIGHGEGGNLALLTASMPVPPAFVVCLAASGLPGSETLRQQQEGMLQSLAVQPEQIAASMKRLQAAHQIIRSMADNAQARPILLNILRQSHESLPDSAARMRVAELTSPAYRSLLTFDPQESLPKVACPVLLLNGTTDTSTNADVNLAALAKGLKNNKAVTTKKLVGVNHLFQPPRSEWALLSGQLRPVFSPEALETIYGWLAARTGKAASSK